jgi:glutamate dehydrogenase (NAD(P)+)
MAHRKEHGKFAGYPATHLKTSREALELECDILVPAALENQIDDENGPRIKAKIIGEGANGPTTAKAGEMLHQRGVMIIPDMYLNAGGVTVSYFEWIKNLSHVRFGRMEKRFEERAFRNLLQTVQTMTGKSLSEEELKGLASGASEEDLVNSGLEETMVTSYQKIREMRRKHNDNPDLRTAAFIVAIDMIALTYSDLGIFP